MSAYLLRLAVCLGLSIVLGGCGGGGDSAGIAAPASSGQPVASVSVSPSAPSLSAGTTLQLSATTTDAANNVLTAPTITWSSSDQARATVSATGLVTGVAAGQATISATSEGKVGAASVTVTTVPASTTPVASVAIYPAGTTLLPAQTWQLTGTTKDATGKVLDGRTVTWSSSNTAAATVVRCAAK